MLRRALRQLALGLAFGVVCTLVWGRLFGDPSARYAMTDPLVLIPIAVLMAGVAAVACVSPAWRATRIDPSMALRFE